MFQMVAKCIFQGALNLSCPISSRVSREHVELRATLVRPRTEGTSSDGSETWDATGPVWRILIPLSKAT